MKPQWEEAVKASGVLEALADYDPHVAGTPPLGIAIDTSDIDILCTFKDAPPFETAVQARFAHHEAFAMRRWTTGRRAVVANFRFCGWDFEVYAEPIPVAQQYGWRHFVVEQRLLRLGGEPIRSKVLELKTAGMKTEPAFARALGLTGSGYDELLELADRSDESLLALLKSAGYIV
ncbi:MAG: DUF4269 domain-containing protein [Hyphomicrobiaceae bacterium]|nr:DUF4269 domain-containing protein [Hyphomicrobiaceae bacterium]